MDAFSSSLSVIAFGFSVLSWYRDKIFFRGSDVTLANQTDKQHATLVPFGEFPQGIRNLIPDYHDSQPCVLVQAVWLNTGDRAGFVHVNSIRAEARGKSYRPAYYGYIDVSAGTACQQPIVVRNLPADGSYDLDITIDFSWLKISRGGRRLEPGRGVVHVSVRSPHAPMDEP